MTELERSLVRLGAEVAFPETPDLTAAVLARIAREPAGRRLRPGRRALVLVFVVLLVSVGAVLAVPSARTAVLEFFGLRGATVRRVDTLPQPPRLPPASAAALELGRPLPLEDGRPVVDFPLLVVPEALGPPDAAYRSAAVPGGKVSLVYEPGPGVPRSAFTGVGILVTQFRGDLEPAYVDKLVGGDTRVEQLTIGGRRALWLEGGAHFVLFRDSAGGFREDTARLAGNTLLLQDGLLLVRIEGELDRGRAVAIAESLAPPGSGR